MPENGQIRAGGDGRSRTKHNLAPFLQHHICESNKGHAKQTTTSQKKMKGLKETKPAPTTHMSWVVAVDITQVISPTLGLVRARYLALSPCSRLENFTCCH